MILIAFGFVSGAWLIQQQAVLPPIFLLVAIFVGLFLIGILVFKLIQSVKLKSLLKPFSLFFLAGSAGFLYATIFASVRLSDELPTAWQQRSVDVIGVVASMPSVHPRGERFRFDVEQVMTHEAHVPKRILLNAYHANSWNQTTKNITQRVLPMPATFKVGERWRLTVRLKRPHTTYNPHGYDFEAWALAHNIRAMGTILKKSGMQKLTDFVWRPSYMVEYCREKVAARMEKALGDRPYAGVIRALVVGDGGQISKQDWDVYLHTGVNHLMSISGLHITMLAGLAFSFTTFIWRRFPQLVLQMPTRKVATIAGVCVALLYACLAGLSVPTQRTLYMLSTFAGALLLSRRINMSRVLSIAVLVVVLLDPWAVVAPGFWLSFSAVAIITYATVNRLQLRHWLVEAIHTQWSVTLGLLPFLIAMFGQASIVSPVANGFAIPIISLLVVPLSILGALLPIDLILQLAHQILAFCMLGLNWLADQPFATWQQAAAPVWTIGVAMVGMLWVLLPRGFPQRWLGLILMLPMFFVKPSVLAEGEMQVTVLDVGQGLSVVIKTATHAMVYDTGQQYNQDRDAGDSIVVPYLRSIGIQQLDALVVSHDDNDHSGGVSALLAQVPVEWVAASYVLPNEVNVKSKQPKQRKCYAGQRWYWDGVRFEVLSPSIESYQDETVSDNNRSCVVKVSSRYGSVLLTGDIEAEVEGALLQKQKYSLKSDVLIVPHHGSKTSSTEGFVKSVAPKYAIFTVGYLNRFKHPKPLIVSRYLERRSTMYQSDYHGAVLIDFTKSHPLAIDAWRSGHSKYWHDKFL